MHKKHTKLNHKEHRHNAASRRGHLKNRDTDDSTLEVIKAPQNSRKELSKKLEFGDHEDNAKFKSNKDKHKHKRKESKSNDRHCKIMYEKNMNIQDLLSAKEQVKHSEKKEKRDKERLNKIEKYLEGMNKVDSKKLLHNRPLSLDSSKALLSNKEKHIRREKTFHDKTSRDVSTNSHLNILQDQQSPTTIKEKLHKPKKHKHKENNKGGSSKEKNIKDNQQSVMYCEVELQSPFLQEKKKYNVERLFPETSKEKSSRKRSSSRDNSAFSQLESTLTSQRGKTKHLKDTATIPVKFSSRKSKLTIDLRSHRDPRSNVSLGPYGKYFAFDKTFQNETARQKKKKRRDGTTKLTHREKRGDSKEEHVKLEKTKKKQKTNPNSDSDKAKIDDDIKSYFCKIQNLIDKKLDFILGNNSNSKESKSNSVEKENDAFKIKSIKEKKAEFRDRSHSKRKKKESDRCKSIEERKQEKNLDEEKKAKRSDEEKKAVRESTQKYTEVPNVSLKRERYPSEDSRNYRRSRSPQQQKRSSSPLEKRRSDKDVQRHQRHESPYPEYSTHKISPDRLIKILEHPSTFSVQSSTSILKKKHAEVKRRSNDTQTNPECNQKRDRSLGKKNTAPNEDNLNIKDLEKTHQQEAYSKKLKKRMTETHSNSTLNKGKLIGVSKYGSVDTHSEINGNEHRHKRGRSSTRRTAIPGEDDFEETDLLKVNNKKLKKRMRQLMNLECKTVSIVGIPSQIRESTIFNETQTTTSLNIINPTEDMIEQKKKSKRFKLYYKYSVADNKCPHESDKSSEGKKSIVSDSYRVVSDPSDCNLEVCEDKEEISKNTKKESDPDLAKILFIMKKEKSHRNCGDVSKKIRKRGDSPKPIILNNIVEEPSNISIVIRANDNPPPLKKDLNCTFFKTLKSSSSGCNLEPIRKSTQGNPNKHKNCNPLKDNSMIPKSSPKKISERQRENKKLKYEEKRGYNKKIKKMESHHRIKKKYREMNNYTSKSDINISYDSLTEHKFKGKHKPNGPSHFREELRQLLPDIFFRKSSPERKSIGIIIKEGIREIIREIPKNVMREISFTEESNRTNKSINIPDRQEKNSRESDSKEPIETFKNHNVVEKTYCTKRINEIDSNENIKIQDVEEAAYSSKKIMADENLKIQNAEEQTYYSEKAKDSQETDSKLPTDCPKVPDVEEKSYCSKKIGTCNTMSRIPSLIKGYTGATASQIIRDESIKAHNSTDQVYADDVTGNRNELDEKNLVDVATEVSITEEVADKAVIILENKKSQTPSYLDAPTVVTICDATKQYKYSKKIATTNNVKRCQITDSFGEPKMGSVCKSTRPIINLENDQFPSRKLPESERCSAPVSGQYKTLEEKTVTFENQEKFQPRKLLETRPATADERRTEPSSLNKFRQKPTNRALTMSTNVVTIDGSICRETSGTCNTHAEWSRNDIKDNSVQEKTFDRHTVTTLKKNQESLFSKSSMSLNDVDMESRIGSLVCVDRYSNAQKINFSSNSNSRSLDRYTTKSLISDQPHASRLFLTKSFDPKMNTYQRRKMYDEGIRKKMKKKYGTQSQMGPRIFEVRYLTLENPNLDEGFDTKNSPTPIVNQKCISRLPTYNTKTNKSKLRSKTSKISTKKSRKIFPKNKEDACKFSGRDIFAPVISDVDQLNKFRRKSFPEKKVEEIFVKKNSQERNLSDKELNSSFLKNGINNEEQICKMSKVGSENTHQNFKDLVDHLYNSIVSYCDTKFKSSQEPSLDPTQIDNDGQSITRSPPVNEKSYVIFPKHSNETMNNSYKKNSCSEGNVAGEEKEPKRPTNLIFSHLSCPVLAGSTSSFDYLYEDGPIEINKDAVLLHFKKPMKTILGYALNNPNRIQRETFRQFLKKEYQTSNSVTESEESGYSSSNSKKCTSVSRFFKKPSIANLFKPVKKLETSLQSTSSLNDTRSGPNLQEYSVMNQKCIEYAEKVRNQTKNKDKSEETFQEIPLDVLLFCRKSSALLSDFNSNCSLCKKHSNSDLPDITEADELSNNSENRENLLEMENIIKEDILIKEMKSADTLIEDNVQKETLFFYKDIKRKPSLEITTLQRSQTSFAIDDTSQLAKEIEQCPVVLSITNLNSCSLTVIEEQSSSNNNFCFNGKQKESIKRIESDAVYSEHINLNEKCHISKSDLKSSAQMDVDSKSNISWSFGSRYSNSPSVASKFMAKRFFHNLLKVYEKEIDVTNKLFQDDDFFLNVLLESVKSEEIPKPKNFKLKELIKDRIKNCIGNMFYPKNCMDKPRTCVDALTSCNFDNKHQGKLQILAGDARKYFSMFVQAVKTNKDINDEIKICGLLKLLERIEDGDFAILRKKEEVDFEEEIKEQVKEAFVSIYRMSVKEARKRRRSLTTDDLKLIRTFVSKYRIGLLSKTDLIATYIGKGVFRTEGHLKAAVTYLIQQNKTKDIDLKDFDEHCKILAKY